MFKLFTNDTQWPCFLKLDVWNQVPPSKRHPPRGGLHRRQKAERCLDVPIANRLQLHFWAFRASPQSVGSTSYRALNKTSHDCGGLCQQQMLQRMLFVPDSHAHLQASTPPKKIWKNILKGELLRLMVDFWGSMGCLEKNGLFHLILHLPVNWSQGAGPMDRKLKRFTHRTKVLN